MLSVLIVDDEMPARHVLRSYLETMSDVHIVGEAENGRSAAHLAALLKPDLVLLDVEMPEMNGIETAALLPPGTAIVFVTAYDRYAIKAFELHAFDYILKPVMKDRLEEAIRHVQRLHQRNDEDRQGSKSSRSVQLDRQNERAENRDALKTSHESDIKQHNLAALLEYFRMRQSYLTRLTIKSNFEYMVLSVYDVSCIRVEGGLVFIYSRGMKYLHDTPLKKLEQHLDPDMFLRIHRNALVNRNHVKRIITLSKGHYAVETSDHITIPISRDSLTSFKNAMGWEL
ncbi:MAG: LytTR family DNA-binding domain-containing protein [Rectinema sp.]|nr:LytTR family DNA-binding domain-containing protein [Rectinema sp.]